MKRWAILAISLTAGLVGCRGELSVGGDDAPRRIVAFGDDDDEPSDTSDPVTAPHVPEVVEPLETLDELDSLGFTGLRRLTRNEVRNSLTDALGVDPGALVEHLPLDIGGTTLFDNTFASQAISGIDIEEYVDFAAQYAGAAAASNTIAQTVGGCSPSGADDAACASEIVAEMGRRLFRRPLDQSRVDSIVATFLPFAIEDDEFATFVELTTAYFVLHPEFLYRAEAAQPAPLYAVDDYEIATRMSYLLWGSGPDDELLDLAAEGALSDEIVRSEQARRMLADPRARRQWLGFHAQWLGYSEVELPDDLRDAMLAETHRLVADVVFDNPADWMDIFRKGGTWASAELAAFYDLTAPDADGWVPYDARRGGGVLSHATFLHHGYKGGNFDDTSPTLRGYEVFKRLSCGVLGGIPETVDPDNPPGAPSDCKADAYTMRDDPACTSCHTITDGIGFGLENFGPYGEYRDAEPGKAGCDIDGVGEYAGRPFRGPAELGELLAAQDVVQACATRQLYRFASGRLETPDDEQAIAALAERHESLGSLSEILVELVASPAFLMRNGDD